MFEETADPAEKSKAYPATREEIHPDQCGGRIGKPGAAGCEPKRASLRQRVEDRKRSALREARNAEAFTELASLLDENPQIARILELMEQM